MREAKRQFSCTNTHTKSLLLSPSLFLLYSLSVTCELKKKKSPCYTLFALSYKFTKEGMFLNKPAPNDQEPIDRVRVVIIGRPVNGKGCKKPVGLMYLQGEKVSACTCTAKVKSG